jgi:ADP-ribosylglycohydrolase
MRNAPVSLFFANAGDVEQAMLTAYRQSKATHQGDEAAECCRLLTFATLKCIQSGDMDPDQVKSTVFGPGGLLQTDFQTSVMSVRCLANGEQEPSGDENRRWTWREKRYRYSPQRASSQPGYIGSYSMDALSMALHCVWTTSSLVEGMVKAASLRGDADTVCAIAGQLCGALYGASELPSDWMDAVNRWDPNLSIITRAKATYYHDDTVVRPEACH